MSKEINNESWLTVGIDIINRRIDLIGEVDESMKSQLLRGLITMNDINTNPISIYLSSQGGDAYIGFGIYDLLRESLSNIHMYAHGTVMSAASIIYLAGDKRFGSENVTFMLHGISFGSEGKVRDQEVDVLEGKRLNKMMLDVISKRTKINKKQAYRNIVSSGKDWYIALEEAKQLKIINS